VDRIAKDCYLVSGLSTGAGGPRDDITKINRRRVVARAWARGMPIDGDPEFMAIVELWIAGEIEADGCGIGTMPC